MGQSLSQMYIHVVYGTKGRANWISSEIEVKLHAYLSGIFKELESPVIEINSVPDHIHVLFRLSKNHALSKVLKETKGSSSKWMKSQGIADFSWQIGYGAFSVSASKLDVVKRYIKNQKEHHFIKTFKEELEEFISEYNLIQYETKFFWDE